MLPYRIRWDGSTITCIVSVFWSCLRRKCLIFGIPDDDFNDDETLPSWDFKIDEFFVDPGDKGMYTYDFGDNWEHEILLEGVFYVKKA